VKLGWKPVTTKEEMDTMHTWVLENYKPLGLIQGTWHPVVQLSCIMISCIEQDYDVTPDLLQLLLAALKNRARNGDKLDPSVLRFMEMAIFVDSQKP
jgi:hypothetical protein